jgi:hypothetical protein
MKKPPACCKPAPQDPRKLQNRPSWDLIPDFAAFIPQAVVSPGVWPRLRVLLLAFTILADGSLAAAENEIDVGHSAAGQLKVEVGFDFPLGLPVSPFPGLPGYATGEVGLHSTAADDPANDFFQLSTSSDFRLILQARDPGIEVLNDHGSAYMTNGEGFFIGSAPFDTHPLWNIVSGTAGNDYSLTFIIQDLNGIYSDSAPFQVIFTPVAPATLSIQDNHNKTVTIKFEGTPGLDYVVQVSSTVGAGAHWTSVSTNNAGDSGVWSITESTAGRTARFYRAITP